MAWLKASHPSLIGAEPANSGSGAPSPRPADDIEKSEGVGGIEGGVSGDGLEAQEAQQQQSQGLLSRSAMDGTRPLAAYRRLLAMLYHVRNIRHESGPGFETLPGKGGVNSSSSGSGSRRSSSCSAVVQKTESEFRALEKVSGFFERFSTKAFSCGSGASGLTGGCRHVPFLDGWRSPRLQRQAPILVSILDVPGLCLLAELKGLAR